MAILSDGRNNLTLDGTMYSIWNGQAHLGYLSHRTNRVYICLSKSFRPDLSFEDRQIEFPSFEDAKQYVKHL